MYLIDLLDKNLKLYNFEECTFNDYKTNIVVTKTKFVYYSSHEIMQMHDNEF